ncbi:glycoside hydrolase family 31 protein [Sneathia vaginalis]|jgi:hypothetical protein|uniref:glycoside hydrolase family 31 protein n=1 Tax=Sneathia vaginalis TaxID=187101 RepID=UPI0028896102|nr:TIM-barrel domain-containing protein [Sneathia vaginalis]
MYIEKYNDFNPLANPKSIIIGKGYRITLLTSKLVRLEYSKNNIFEDARTKMVINRNFPEVLYEIYEDENSLKIITKDITLRYNKREFSPYGLSIELNGKTKHPYKEIWHFNDKLSNLGGTIRTLDFIDGEVELDDGILSEYGISVIDDSNSPILLENGWYEDRNSNEIDLYVFAYKRNYKEALKDFFLLTGPQPKLPRYALGNWWSRYYPYDENSYKDLLEKFENEKLPFSVAVLDMDWHLVDIPEKYGSIWTGYTWNHELFPDPKRFIDYIKGKGYKITLNIHPSAGIRPFEIMYRDFAKAMNIDPNKDLYIDFDHKSKTFFENTFKYLYKPNEDIGVDFWWIDWQQSPTKIDENKDPLWVLNHYHYNDNKKNNNIGLTFSRYAGPGSHRYPVGFSGDTVISWKSLDFQPYFTSTASNIGYGWWSHDIGGHRHGYRSDELTLRWIQFGVFSPINRLHSSNSEFIEKEPWNFKEPYKTIIGEYLRLRHELIPYTYTMNVIANTENIPLIRPMYYEYPENKESYKVKNQYYFGSELLICPITKKINEESEMAEFKAWLPKGNWYDLQIGLKYSGNRNITINRGIENLGIFFKEGSIIPLAKLKERINNIDNPENLRIIIGSGDDGEFNLIEDNKDNLSNVESVTTNFKYLENDSKILIHKAEGNINVIPRYRSFEFNIYGKKIKKVMIKIKDSIIEIGTEYNFKKNITSFIIREIPINENVEITFEYDEAVFDSKTQKLDIIKKFLKKSQMSNVDKDEIYKILVSNKDYKTTISEILNYDTSLAIKNVLLEIILA